MKVLVIPDVHLKPHMFRQAARLMERGIAEQVVCLMDIPDDWDKEYNIELYVETFDAAIAFVKKYPDALWAYGNHDLMWNDASPIWHRPQYSNGRMYKTHEILQVVGHTPVDEISRKENVISCDVFSTYRDGRPIGTQEFLLIDTETWEYSGVKG